MIAAYFLAALALVPAPRKVVETGGTTTNAAVTFRFDGSLPKEGYRLKVTDAGAEIAYADGAGKLYARVTLDQLKNPDGATAKAEIEDYPAYPWRGWLIDVGRHFLPKENIFDVLDLMVLHKMNVLHWHLTEDEGWRLPTARHPDTILRSQTLGNGYLLCLRRQARVGRLLFGEAQAMIFHRFMQQTVCSLTSPTSLVQETSQRFQSFSED